MIRSLAIAYVLASGCVAGCYGTTEPQDVPAVVAEDAGTPVEAVDAAAPAPTAREATPDPSTYEQADPSVPHCVAQAPHTCANGALQYFCSDDVPPHVECTSDDYRWWCCPSTVVMCCTAQGDAGLGGISSLLRTCEAPCEAGSETCDTGKAKCASLGGTWSIQ